MYSEKDKRGRYINNIQNVAFLVKHMSRKKNLEEKNPEVSVGVIVKYWAALKLKKIFHNYM